MHVDTLSPWHIQLVWVEAHLVQDRGMHVGDVVRIFHCVEPEFVRCSMCDATFDTATCHPAQETLRVMVAARSLSTGCTAKLGTKHNKR